MGDCIGFCVGFTYPPEPSVLGFSKKFFAEKDGEDKLQVKVLFIFEK
jgi:hypothetical protein